MTVRIHRCASSLQLAMIFVVVVLMTQTASSFEVFSVFSNQQHQQQQQQTNGGNSSSDINSSSILNDDDETSSFKIRDLILAVEVHHVVLAFVALFTILKAVFSYAHKNNRTSSSSMVVTETSDNSIKNSTLVSVQIKPDTSTASSRNTLVSAFTTATNTLPWQFLSLVGIGIASSVVFQTTRTPIWASFVSKIWELSQWYSMVLTTYPLATKSITTAVIQYLGDLGAQWVEHLLARGTNDQPEQENRKRSYYDPRRGLACAIDGLILSGPILHFAYDYMERVLPIGDPTNGSTSAALLHVLFNDFLLDAMFVAILFVSTGITEGCARDIPLQMHTDYFPAVKASWASSVGLFPIEFLCFRFLPLSFRVLSMNMIDIIWGALISYMAHRSRHGKSSADVGENHDTKKQDDDAKIKSN